MNRQVSSTRLIRTYNVSTVLQVLYKQGSCTRSELAQLTGMSPATITRIISELMEQEIVLEGRVEKSTGGRRPVQITIDQNKLYIIGVKLLQADSTLALLNLQGEIIEKLQLSTESLEPNFLINEVILKTNELLQKYNTNKEHILGVGVAVAGVCHSREGLVLNSVNLGWENVPLAEMLHKKLGLPIYIENDANTSALAEFWFGHAKEAESSLFLKTETGAGVGIILESKLISGKRFLSGEIGHVPIVKDGYKCRCGQNGCLEPYVYFGDIKERYNNKQLTRTDFINLVQAKDEKALQIVSETASVLAQACAHWGILLDADVITIGGFWGDLLTEVIEPCQIYYDKVLKSTGLESKALLRGASFGEDTDLLGATGLVLNHWFTPYPVALDR